MILASFNLPVIFNEQFLKIKNTIEKESAVILGKNVQIGDIGFLPYGEIILKNIKIQDKEKRLSYIEIEKFNIRFSVLEFLISNSATFARHKKSKEFYLKGAAVFKKPGVIGPVKYKLNIIMTPDVISIRNLCLDLEKFSVDIKGNINNYAASPKAELNIASKEINIHGVARINNLYGSVILSKSELLVKNLDFFVNNFPLGISCEISDFKSPAIELRIISYPGQLPVLRPFNPFNFELNYSGKKLGNSINGNLTLRTQKLTSINPRETYHAVIRLDGLSCVFANKAAFVDVKNIICETDTAEKVFNVNASDFKTHVYLGKTKIYFTGLSVSAYKGLLKGNGFLDSGQWPPKLLLDFKVYRLDVVELTKSLELNYELKGNLDFKGVFNNRREPCLSGRLDVADGYLKNAQVLGLISDFLSTPSLKNVYFEHISSLVSFSPANKEAMFDKISISGLDMNLSGNMMLKNMKKINGNISVRLSTKLLKESFKLRLLFLLVGERLPYQNFEFEIGGFLNSPQIRWLSTRFKENVLKYLTSGGKQTIENSLEQAMDELLSSN
ncbi:MAG: hypothetical protein NTX47_03145 [Candidatus Omnitrophica bacterium]|nr:hypothetical protein [Candidatus Omnitrophota bacterium]